VKTALKGKRFQDDEDSKKNVTAELKTFPFEAFPYFFKNFLSNTTQVFGRRLL
jgi:hypothetical protein